MKKFINFLLIFIFISLEVNSNENLLTIQQQLERIQREVTDLSQIVYSDKVSADDKNNSNLAINLSAIDMRIYDIEKDLKNLTANFEDVMFQIEDLIQKINNFEESIFALEDSILEIKNYKPVSESNKSSDNEINELNEENTLGSLKITKQNNTIQEDVNQSEALSQKIEPKTTPEDQFQIAFDNIRNKNWDDAKTSFINFIENNPENQLSGSAHYWLGELYILEKKYRDAALVFAEGYQKFPKSIKAPDMLLKLSESLYNVDKTNESCKTLEKLIADFPKNKLIKNANKQFQNYGCLEISE